MRRNIGRPNLLIMDPMLITDNDDICPSMAQQLTLLIERSASKSEMLHNDEGGGVRVVADNLGLTGGAMIGQLWSPGP